MFSAGVAGAESAVPVAIDQLSNAAALAEGPCVGGGAYVDGVFLDEAALAERESELATLTAHLDAATHRQLTLIRIIDVSERWAKQGAKSCAHWLSWRVGIALGAAREKVRVARRLGGLEKIDDALRRGALSYSKVRAMTRVATPANEEKLLNIALETTAAQLEKKSAAACDSSNARTGESRTTRSIATCGCVPAETARWPSRRCSCLTKPSESWRPSDPCAPP